MDDKVEYPTARPPSPSLVIERLELDPAIRIIRLPNSESYNAIGHGRDGRDYPVTAGTTFTFQQADGARPDSCPGGTCRPLEPGKYIVTGTFTQPAGSSPLTATATLQVLPRLRDTPLVSFARRNITLVASVVGAFIFALRCFAVTRGDPYEAFILLSQTTLSDAIRALLFSTLPALLTIVGIVFACMAGREFVPLFRLLPGAGFTIMAAIAMLFGAGLSGNLDFNSVFYLSSNLFFFALLGIGISVLPILKSNPTPTLPQPRVEITPRVPITRRVASILGATVAVLGLLSFLGFLGLLGLRFFIFGVPPIVEGIREGIRPVIGDQFWLPRERLDFHGEDPFTGYVLKTRDDYLVIMDESRVISQRKKDTLEDREFCYLEGDETLPSPSRVQESWRKCPRE